LLQLDLISNYEADCLGEIDIEIDRAPSDLLSEQYQPLSDNLIEIDISETRSDFPANARRPETTSPARLPS
jgi:hypothetical protein